MARVPAAERREQFIQAAVRVVAADGVEGATTRRIAAEAGAPLAALHYCFASKEELFYAVYERHVGTLDQVWHVRPNAGLGRTAATLLRQVSNYYLAEQDTARSSMELFYWVTRQDAALGRKVYDIHVDVIVKHLRVGVRTDDDPALVEPVARLLTSMSDGFLMQWIAYQDDARYLVDVDLAAESLEQLTLAHRSAPPHAS